MKTIIITITAILLSLTTSAQRQLYSTTKDSSFKISYQPINNIDTLYEFEYLYLDKDPRGYSFKPMSFLYVGEINKLYNLFKDQLDLQPNTITDVIVFRNEVGTMEISIKPIEVKGHKHLLVRQHLMAGTTEFTLSPSIINTLFKKQTNQELKPNRMCTCNNDRSKGRWFPFLTRKGGA